MNRKYVKTKSNVIRVNMAIALLIIMLMIAPIAVVASPQSISASDLVMTLQETDEAMPLVIEGDAQETDLPIGTHAQSAAMIDVASGRMLLSHRGDERMLIASLTKVMTAIVAIESGQLTDQVKVGRNAVGKEGSSLYLRLDEEMSLEHLLYGLMLRSGNDAATAIAEHVGGSEEGFAVMMNERAEALGMHNSHFVNPHGLDAEGHYSTANDMAKLTAYALQNATFRDVVKTKMKRVPNPNESWQYTWYNKNKMLLFYEGGDGVKTGFTKKAGRCLISSATRDGRQIAVVTLNDGNDWFDHTQWLNYGFASFESHVLINKGDQIAGTSFVAGNSLSYPLLQGEYERIKTTVSYVSSDTVNYKLGERGLQHFWLDNELIGSVPFYEEQSAQWDILHGAHSTFQRTGGHWLARSQSYRSVIIEVFKAAVNA